MTESSVDVVVIPQNAVQSFETIPAASNSLPRLTVPACNAKIIHFECGEFHNIILYIQLMEPVGVRTVHRALVQ